MSRWSDVLLLRLRSLFRRSLVDRELDKELRFHLDEQIEELVAAGMARRDARLQTLRDLGSETSIAQQCRETRRVTFIENLLQDLRYTARVLLKQPMLVVAAATSIALGVGANLTIFSLANSLLLSTPTSANPERLVHIRSSRGSHMSYPMWDALNSSGVVAGVAGYDIENDVNVRMGDGSISVMPLLVSANFFEVIGVSPLMGRGFTAQEADAYRDPRVTVITHRFWATRLRSDPAVIGSSLMINGVPFTVLGVLPEDLRSLPGYGIAPDIWLPSSPALVPNLDSPRGGHFQIIGRLRDGQSIESAFAALDTVAARFAPSEFPEGVGAIKYVAPVGGLSQLNEFREVAVFFAGLVVVTWLVLGIACANVAGLLLARGIARRKEIAMRLAIGATRKRLIQQLLTEGLLLSALGTAIGFGLTAIVARLVERVRLPLPFPVAIDVVFDTRLVLIASVMVIASTILCAMVPALQATRPSVLPSLKLEMPSYGHRRLNLRGMMVVGQVAISALLLVITVLFLRNLSLARTASIGFDADRVVLSQLTFVEGKQGTAARHAVETMAERLRLLPGIEAVSFAAGIPLTLRSGGTTGTDMRIDGREGLVRVEYDNNRVGPDYFRVMGISLLRGREFRISDRAGAPEVAIVNEEFVRRYFEGQDPIGRAIYIDRGRQEALRAEVVGVVANSKYTTIGEDRDAAVYTSVLRGEPDRLVHLLARTASPATALPVVRHAIDTIDPDAANATEPLESALAVAFLPSRIGAAIVGALGALGIVLAMIGLYGVISFAVTRRTPEIGIRLALGSTRRAIAAVVLQDGAWLVGVGMIAGLGLALIITKPLSTFLVADLAPTDAVSFLTTIAVLSATSTLAGWGPMRRAMRVEPAVTLRAD